MDKTKLNDRKKNIGLSSFFFYIKLSSHLYFYYTIFLNMALSFINFFYLLLLITPLDFSLAKKCYLSEEYQVHVINKLPSNPPQLKIHCASKNDDLGYHDLAINDDFNWSFCNAVFSQTLFFCHFWWSSKQKAFDVFNDQQHCVSDVNVTNSSNDCKWVVQADGFYLEQYNATDGTYYLHHYLDWS